MLDGAWGVLLQSSGLSEADFRGERFADHPRDLLNNPDLLNITRPDVVRKVHESYFAAGRRHRDDEHVHRDVDRSGGLRARGGGLRHERRRRAARARGRRRPVRRRLCRAAQHHALAQSRVSTSRGIRTHTFDQVVEAYSEQIRGLADGGVDLLLIETIFDPLNCKAAIARRARGRAATAALDQRHDRRSLGPHADGADDRSVLDVDRARGPTDRRRQLLPRREGDAAVRRRPVARRDVPHLVPPERRPAERLRRLRRDPRGDVEAPARVRPGRLPERRRLLLRLDARAHEGDRGSRTRVGAPNPCKCGLHTKSLVGLGDVRDRTRHGLRPDRRADECDRLGALPAHGRGGRLRRGDRGRARAGARRRQPARRQHGRRPARGRRGDAHVPERRRHRARGRAAADHGRQLEVDGARGGPAVPPGQGHRQLDLAQGRRGGLPPPGAARARLRRRRRRDGVRRGGPGDRRRAARRDLRARLRPARRTRSASRPRTSSSTRTCSPSRRGSTSTTTTRARSSTACRAIKERCPGARTSGGISNLSFSFRGNDVVREAMHAVFLLPRDPRRPRHGHRQRRAARGLRGHRARAARARRGRDLQPPPRRDRAARRDRRERPRRGHASASSTCAGARRRSRSGSSTRSCTASSTTSRTTPRRRAKRPHARST